MDTLYLGEKRTIVERYLRTKEFYHELKQNTELKHNENYDPDKFWLDSFNREIELLDIKYGLGKENPTKYSWVGINPSPEVYKTMRNLYERLEELPLTNYYACVEGHTKEGYRPHIHMILFTHHKPYRMIEKLAKHFKCEKNFIQYKNMTQFYNEKMDYIKGIKTDEKEEFVNLDIEERDFSNIPHFIEK